MLHELLDRSAQAFPHHTALDEAEGASLRYDELADLSDRVRDRLAAMGVQPGDRVGIYLRKSIDSVVSIFGILKAGAAYVPVDPQAPPARNAYIFANCSVRAVIVERRFEALIREELAKLKAAPELFVLNSVGGGAPLTQAIHAAQHDHPAPATPTAKIDPNDLAYLLYTSGSTGMPKGVMLSHCNAMCFVDWCSRTFQPRPSDRFSAHAPFHFDLSILDLYVPIKHGATMVLIGEELGKDPARLGPAISQRRISVWYSAPSILSLLAQHGGLDVGDYTAVRLVLFAGEVFPVKHLRLLKSKWPHPRYFNLYGPTETNVCTYYELPAELEPDRTDPYPIGRVCEHYRGKICDSQGNEVPEGNEGELLISGAGVMQGYWDLPDNTDRAFCADSSGDRWYRTGDIVIEQPDRELKFMGRRDRMIKKRGYRVELGEIEAALYRHAGVKEAAVIGVQDEEHGVRIKAFVSTHDGQRLSLIDVKRFCAGQLPLYMVPDFFSFVPSIPKTSTDKTDYQRLKDLE